MEAAAGGGRRHGRPPHPGVGEPSLRPWSKVRSPVAAPPAKWAAAPGCGAARLQLLSPVRPQALINAVKDSFAGVILAAF